MVLYIPSPERPYVFRIEGDIPALKNEKILVPITSGPKKGRKRMISSENVTQWYDAQRVPLKRQLQKFKDVQKIQKPEQAYVRFELYCRNAVSRLDLDNMYTTVQELLQPDSVTKKGILGILYNDKCIRGYSAVQMPLTEQIPFQTAFLWVWRWPEGEFDDINLLTRFRRHRHEHMDQFHTKDLPDILFE